MQSKFSPIFTIFPSIFPSLKIDSQSVVELRFSLFDQFFVFLFFCFFFFWAVIFLHFTLLNNFFHI